MTRLEKAEKRAIVIVMAVIALAGIVVAIMFFAQMSKEQVQQEQSTSEAKSAFDIAYDEVSKVAQLGETVSLTSNAERAGRVLPWQSGTKEITVNRAVVYDTLRDALANEDLGNVIAPSASEWLLSAKNGMIAAEERFLVLEVTIHNIDAVNFGKDIETTIGSEIVLNADAEEASFSGSPDAAEAKQVNKYTLLPGESATYLIGYWIRSDTDLNTLTAGIGWADNLKGRAPVTVELDIAQSGA